MVNASKILTVSYGTFSCTLEGFDEPFSTMKSIAEYFRDLAADDRYFGAEPPTPDAEMLHRIAEREIQRRVEARVQKNGILLRPVADDAPARDDAPAPRTPSREAPVRAAEPAAQEWTDVAETGAAETVAEKLRRIRAAVARANADDPQIGHAFAEDETAQPAPQAAPIPETAGQPRAAAEPSAVDRAAPESAAPQDEDDTEDGSIPDALSAAEAAPRAEPEAEADSARRAEPEDAAPEIAQAAGLAMPELAMPEDDATEPDEPDAADAAPSGDAAPDLAAFGRDADEEGGDTPSDDEVAEARAGDTAGAPVGDAMIAAFMATDDGAETGELDGDEDIAAEAGTLVDLEEPVTDAPEESAAGDATDPETAGEIAPVGEMEDTAGHFAAAEEEERVAERQVADTWLSQEETAADEPQDADARPVEDETATADEAGDDDTPPPPESLAGDADEDTDEAILLPSAGDETAESDAEARHAARLERDDPAETAELADIELDLSEILGVGTEPLPPLSLTSQDRVDDAPASQPEEDRADEDENDWAEISETSYVRVTRMTRVEFDSRFVADDDEDGDEDRNDAADEATGARQIADAEEAAEVRDAPRGRDRIRAALGDTGLSEADEADLIEELMLAGQGDAAPEETPARTAPRDATEGVETPDGAAGSDDDAPDLPKAAGSTGPDVPVERLLAQTDTELRASDNKRRRSAIAHLKAAVAAVRADGGRSAAQADRETQKAISRYRDDLADAVQRDVPIAPAAVEAPRGGEMEPDDTAQDAGADAAEQDAPSDERAAEGSVRPRRKRWMAPLMLVSEQRVDKPGAEEAAKPVRPRRIRSDDLDGDADAADAGGESADGFRRFVDAVAADGLQELLEASAAYGGVVEGAPSSTRPQIMRRVANYLPEDSFSREEGLRAFGVLLREGRIQRIERGRFVVAPTSRFADAGRKSAAG